MHEIENNLMRIMLINSSELISVLEQYSKKIHLEILSVTDSKEADSPFNKNSVDLVVTDFQSFQLYAACIFKNSMFIIIDDSIDFYELKSLNKNIVSVLHKPINNYELEIAIDTAINQWHLKQQLQSTREDLSKKSVECKTNINLLKTYETGLDTIFKNICEGIVIVDFDFTIIKVNTVFRKICPISNQIYPRKKLTDIKINSCECVMVLIHSIKQQKSVHSFQVNCKYEDTGKKLILSTFQLNEGLENKTMLMIKDITRLAVLEDKYKHRNTFSNIVGKSKEMKQIFGMIKQLSGIDTTVLINGESGTGKELVMEALHYNGNRENKPLVKINCSSLPENLLESELFGHVHGAFTGAVKDRIGRFEAAEGGTLFLDEIGDASPLIQLKLLRVLETKEYERIGDNKTYKADVRIIAATNLDLEERVKQNLFREDFFYRLNVINIQIPPLRKRKEDIPLLVNHFIEHFSKTLNKKFSGISDNVLDFFKKYHWPGNVRELKHVIEHACILCPGDIITQDYINSKLNKFKNHKNSGTIVNEGKDQLLQALEKTGGNKTKAAMLLGIHRKTLYRKLKKHGIDF